MRGEGSSHWGKVETATCRYVHVSPFSLSSPASSHPPGLRQRGPLIVRILEGLLLHLLLLLWLFLPCLNGDCLALDDGSLQRAPAWQNCHLSVPSASFTLGKTESSTIQPEHPKKPNRKTHSHIRPFLWGLWGQVYR